MSHTAAAPPTASADVRFGLVGFGGGGRFFHAPIIDGADGCELTAVVTSDRDRAARVRAELPGVQVVGSLEDLPALGVEAVAISTPAATHTELTERALRAGLPTVCDKPFALDAESARATVALARELGVLLSPYQNRRYDADLRTLVRVLAQGELGDVVRFESGFERWAAGDPPAAGGGLLRDFGAHLVDQALFLFGPVASVNAQSHGGSGTEDDFRIQLRHTGGVHTELSGSWHQAHPGPRFRVTGTRGSFVLDPPMDGQEEVLLSGRTPRSEGAAWGVEPPSRWGRLVPGGGGGAPVPSEPGAWPEFYATFARAVRGLGPVPVDPTDAIATTAVTDAARLSAAQGRTVALP